MKKHNEQFTSGRVEKSKLSKTYSHRGANPISLMLSGLSDKSVGTKTDTPWMSKRIREIAMIRNAHRANRFRFGHRTSIRYHLNASCTS